MVKYDQIRLRHMLDAGRKVLYFVKGRSRHDLYSNEILALAVTRLLEVLGEAARGLSEEIKDKNPQIPWRQIIGTRDHLIHGYFEVDLDIIWNIVSRDLPPLITELEKLLSVIEI